MTGGYAQHATSHYSPVTNHIGTRPPAGKTLATGGADGHIRLYDSATGKGTGDFIPMPIVEK